MVFQVLLQYIITILEHNKTLQHLHLSCTDHPTRRRGITIEAIQTISRAISDNNTLQILKMDTGKSIYEEVRKNPHQLDPRIIIVSDRFNPSPSRSPSPSPSPSPVDRIYYEMRPLRAEVNFSV